MSYGEKIGRVHVWFFSWLRWREDQTLTPSEIEFSKVTMPVLKVYKLCGLMHLMDMTTEIANFP